MSTKLEQIEEVVLRIARLREDLAQAEKELETLWNARNANSSSKKEVLRSTRGQRSTHYGELSNKIRQALAMEPDRMFSPVELAEKLSASTDSVGSSVAWLFEKGEIDKPMLGMYRWKKLVDSNKVVE